MTAAPLPEVHVTALAYFPTGHFLENLAVRADGSVLITALLHKQLWYVAAQQASSSTGPVEPVLVHTFDHLVTGITEVEPDVFVISLTEAYTTHESHLVRLDLTQWQPGDPVKPAVIYTFDDRVRALNGSCLLAPGVLAVADCFAGLIWRVELALDGRHATGRIWLAHNTMADDPDSELPPPPQPGVNGVRYSPRTGYLYYTSTAQQVFMRVPVDPATLDPTGPPEFVAAITDGDDFCLDDQTGFAYVTRHRANTLDRVPLAPRHGNEVRHLLGDPFDSVLVGPSSAAWARAHNTSGLEDTHQVMYVTTDGGATSPPRDGVVRPAALLRIELIQSSVTP